MRGQLFAYLGAGEHHIAIFAAQIVQLRAVADHQFGPRQIERQEGLDVLLDGDTADIEMDRLGQVEQARRQRPDLFGRARAEQFGVDPARPAADPLEAAMLQLVLDGLGRDHDRRGRGVEFADQAIADRQRHAEAGADIFRELGVIGGGEGQTPLQAIAPGRPAERAFGRDMDRAGLVGLDGAGQAGAGTQRQADLGIGRARHAAELVRRDEDRFVTHLGQFVAQCAEGADHTVDLRMPGIGDDKNTHQVCSAISSGWSSFRVVSKKDSWRFSAQCRISRRPSACSTRAVQLSTQSPSLA